MIKLTKEQIENLLKLASGATPGPYTYHAESFMVTDMHGNLIPNCNEDQLFKESASPDKITALCEAVVGLSDALREIQQATCVSEWLEIANVSRKALSKWGV